jgi:hypothetical protein
MARISPAAKLSRIDTVISAWRALARSASFYGMTLVQFIAAVKPSLDARKEIADLQRRLRRAIMQRDAADKHSFDLISGVGCAVQGDPAYGEDSALYGSMGYRLEIDRRRNIRRG